MDEFKDDGEAGSNELVLLVGGEEHNDDREEFMEADEDGFGGRVFLTGED